MARKANPEKLHEAARLIQEQPGQLSAQYAQWMGCHRQAFNRFLVQMNDRGFLLSEDEHGRLWPYQNPSGKL